MTLDKAWRLGEASADERAIPVEDLGETTWQRPEVDRGIEADLSYFFDPARIETVLGPGDVVRASVSYVLRAGSEIEIWPAPGSEDTELGIKRLSGFPTSP